MALSVAAPSFLEPHIKEYKENVRRATPVGKTINDQWLSATMVYCDWDNKAARELAAKSLKTFFGPARPYLKDQVNIYERLIETWGGVPDHLKANFARYIKTDGANGAPEVDLSGGAGQIASAVWNQFDAPPSLPKSPFPRLSPQGTPEALPSPILSCLSRTRFAALRLVASRSGSQPLGQPAAACGRSGGAKSGFVFPIRSRTVENLTDDVRCLFDLSTIDIEMGDQAHAVLIHCQG